MFRSTKRPFKKGDIVVLVHSFSTDTYDFQKGDVCIVTHVGLFDVDIELKDHPEIWATDLSYSDINKIENV